jgi:cytochrome c-type biogenesis protein CcmE
MRGLKKQRRIQVIVLALVCLIGATGLIGFALRDGINLFRSPTQVVETTPAPGEVFRLGGLVAQGSIRQGEGVHFYFDITDGANTVAVKYVGTDLPPDLFEEGQGTIATGRFSDGLFEATEILAKHDETYMPKEVIDALKEQGVYQGAEGS